jgi:hypothetical protein
VFEDSGIGVECGTEVSDGGGGADYGTGEAGEEEGACWGVVDAVG